jgi:HAD superfamily hydrolase (TIGR01458 family)
MGTVKAILFDLDGVLYDGERVIEGAPGAVRWARDRSIPHAFVTNTTSRPRAALVEKLARFGVAASEDQVFTPAAAAAAWLRGRPGRTALFVPAAARAEFRGLDLLPEGAEEGAAHVVVGDLGEAWDFTTLNRAFRLLHADPETALVALGMTRYWMSPRGVALDVAPFVAALEHAASRKAVVLGKPAAPFFAAAVARLGVAPGDAVMVGDDLSADVAGAQAAGLKGVLVRTGKFRPRDLEGGVRPEAVLDSVADLPKWWDAAS